MRFSDYQIVRAGDSNELQSKVRAALIDGWSPLGPPFHDGRHLMQAMTLELQPADEARIEAAKQLEGITAESALEVLSTLQADAGVGVVAGEAPTAAVPASAEAPEAAPAPAAKTSTKTAKT